MVMMVARKSFYMSGRGDVSAGEEFDLASKHVRVFEAIGRAKRVDGTQIDLAPKYHAEMMKAEQPVPRTEPPEVLVEANSLEEQEEVPEDDDPVVARGPEYVVDALRVRAKALGVDVDGRWGEERLRREIAEAREGRYQRRDMQAKE